MRWPERQSSLRVILFIDLLGARARWKRGGIESSIEAFQHFTRFMISAARPEFESVLDGGIEPDSAAFFCADLASGLRIARLVFLRAFDPQIGQFHEHLWLRGALVQRKGDALQTERAANGP